MASIYDLSATAASNTTIDGTDVSGSTGKIKDGDNVMRSLGAFSAQFIKDTGAVNTVAGTGDAITVTLSSSITAYATGQMFRFIAGAANTTAVTLNVNGIGVKAIRKISGGTDVALVSGDILAGDTYTVIYRASANAAAGGWVMIGVASLASYLTTATAASTYLPLTGKTLTDSLNYAATQTIASATTTDIGAATSNSVIVSGTTTITGLGTVAAGVVRDVLFSGALTLTHSGTALILPGAANITTAANDNATFRSLGSGNWVCLNYKRANGAPIIAAGTSGNLLTSDGTNWASTAPAAAGGMTLLGTLTTTSGATQSLTGIAAGYRQLYCELEGVSNTGTQSLKVALSSTNGAAYGASALIATVLGGGADVLAGGLQIFNISSTTAAAKVAQPYIMLNGASPYTTAGPCPTNTAAVVDAIQFSWTANNFDAGTIRIYGVK